MREQKQNRSKLKRCCIILWMLGMLLGLTACAENENNTDPTPNEQEEKIQIGMSFDSFVIERWIRERDIFVSVAKELGAEVNVQSANGNLEEQRKQIEYFIEKGLELGTY